MKKTGGQKSRWTVPLKKTYLGQDRRISVPAGCRWTFRSQRGPLAPLSSLAGCCGSTRRLIDWLAAWWKGTIINYDFAIQWVIPGTWSEVQDKLPFKKTVRNPFLHNCLHSLSIFFSVQVVRNVVVMLFADLYLTMHGKNEIMSCKYFAITRTQVTLL